LLRIHKKTYYFIFGKGYVGTFKDYIGGFNMGYESAFSREEFINNIFYSPHDTLNVVLLPNGFVGLLSMVYFIRTLFLKASKSIWLVIGITWFIVFYEFSLTINVFGTTCLFLGFNDLSKKKI